MRPTAAPKTSAVHGSDRKKHGGAARTHQGERDVKGGSGRFNWGGNDDWAKAPTVLDKGDPNFDPDEETINA